MPLPAHDLEQAAAAALEQQPADVSDLYQEEAEKRLNDLYNSLSKCKDMAEQVRDGVPTSFCFVCVCTRFTWYQANNEVLLGVFRGRWCFIPGSSCLKRTAWKGFQKDLDQVATHIRKLSRLLWMLHLNFEEVCSWPCTLLSFFNHLFGCCSTALLGCCFCTYNLLSLQGFDENMRSVLKQQYPADLFPQLMEASKGVMQDLCIAWPNGDMVPKRNLSTFLHVCGMPACVCTTHCTTEIMSTLNPHIATSGGGRSHRHQ